MILPDDIAPPQPEAQGFETADTWIAKKEAEIEELIIEIETELELSGINKGDPHNKDSFIHETFNAGLKSILVELAKRLKTDALGKAKYEAFKTKLLAENETGIRFKFFKEWGVKIDKNEELINVSKMTLADLADYVCTKELPFYNGTHDQWSDDNDRKVVDALIQRLWKDKDKVSGTSSDPVVFGSRKEQEKKNGNPVFNPDGSPKMIDVPIYEMRKVRVTKPDGSEEVVEVPRYFSDLDVRESVTDLQILALFGELNEKGKERKDDGVAEGRITELEAVMAKLQISKERLNLTTFAHPRYGRILYEVMRRMKDQPALKEGKVYKPIRLEKGDASAVIGRDVVNDRVVLRNGKKVILIGDRKDSDFQDLLPGDQLLLDYDDTVNGVIPDITEDRLIKRHGEIIVLYGSRLKVSLNPANGEECGFEIIEQTPHLEKGDQPYSGPIPKKINDRVVKRNGMDKLLVGSRATKLISENGAEIGARLYDGDAAISGDIPLYEYDHRFTYETLASDTGKDALKKYVIKLLEDLETQRTGGKVSFEQLQGIDLPDPNTELGEKDLKRLHMYARYLFFSFPFLTNILAVRQERTQAPAHGFNNKDIPYVWIFDMPGFIVHKSQRYANSDTAYYYMLKFFKEFEQGAYGAEGQAGRLNRARDLVIKYDKVYSDGEENVGVIPEMPYGSSVFHTALSMVAMSVDERALLEGYAELYNGKDYKIKPGKLSDEEKALGWTNDSLLLSLDGKAKRINTQTQKPPMFYNFANLFTSIRAWDAFTTRVMQELPDKLSIVDVAEGKGKEKSLIGKVYGDNIGQAKMSSVKTPEKARIPELREYNHLTLAANALWDFVKRIFIEYEATSIDARIELYEQLEKGFKHTAEVGGLSSGDAAYVLSWVLDKMSKPDESGRLYGKGRNGFKGMNPCLGPQEATVTGTRGKEVFEYVEALWNYKHCDADGNVPEQKKFPFKLIPGIKVLGHLTWNVKLISQVFDPDPDIKTYEAMLYGKKYDSKSGKMVAAHLPAPFERIDVDKHDD